MGSDAMLAALAELMPSQEQLQELLKVLDRMRYEAGAGGRQELSFEQISEGLQKLGYRLDPSEVELLLREVAGTGGGLSQSQFIASQVRRGGSEQCEHWGEGPVFSRSCGLVLFELHMNLSVTTAALCPLHES